MSGSRKAYADDGRLWEVGQARSTREAAERRWLASRGGGGFSYGFRPGRSQHHGLDALYAGLLTRKVSWVLDLDIRGFFDTIDHGWLVKFLEHRIGDKRIVRLIQKWLNAGVLEDGKRLAVTEGTPQGGSASPLLANVYLHHVFDLWAQKWRRTQASGDIIAVRLADDIVMGFEHRSDAERFQRDLAERMARFPGQGAWLRSVVAGHVRYYGVPMNGAALSTFRFQVGWLWMRTLRRRGQRHRLTWARMKQHIDRWLPPARPCHPYPLKRLGVIT